MKLSCRLDPAANAPWDAETSRIAGVIDEDFAL
jgi:hypothetical protein